MWPRVQAKIDQFASGAEIIVLTSRRGKSEVET
jgi:hypothetical protein